MGSQMRKETIQICSVVMLGVLAASGCRPSPQQPLEKGNKNLVKSEKSIPESKEPVAEVTEESLLIEKIIQMGKTPREEELIKLEIIKAQERVKKTLNRTFPIYETMQLRDALEVMSQQSGKEGKLFDYSFGECVSMDDKRPYEIIAWITGLHPGYCTLVTDGEIVQEIWFQWGYLKQAPFGEKFRLVPLEKIIRESRQED